MAIPRRLLVVAASAATAGVLWYMAQRAKKAQESGDRKDSAVDEANKAKAKDSGSAAKADDGKADDGKADDNGSPAAAAEAPKTGGDNDGAKKELALFLAGDAWHDEIGWQALWEKDSVATPDAWLRVAGTQVLQNERKKLAEHPALLAGCRRRWIVVCRYAGIDVGEAATLWNEG